MSGVRSAAAQSSAAAALMQRVYIAAESVYRGASTSSQRKWHEMSLAAIFTKYWQCLMNCEGSKEPSRQPAIPGALASVLQDARSFFAGQCTRRLGHIAARGHHKPRAHTLSCEDLAKTKAKPSSIKKNGARRQN